MSKGNIAVGDIVKARLGRRGLWAVKVLAVLNAGRHLRVQRLPHNGPLRPPFQIKTERVER